MYPVESKHFFKARVQTILPVVICSHLLFNSVLYFCSDYMTCVVEALELEDTIRNYEQRYASGW